LIEDGPHAVNLSHPEKVNAALRTFFAELSSEDPTIKR